MAVEYKPNFNRQVNKSVSGGTGMKEHDSVWASESLSNCRTQCITDHGSNCVGVEFKTNPVGSRKCRTYTGITSTPNYYGWDVSFIKGWRTLKDVSVSGGGGMIEHDHTWASESLKNCKTQCITDHGSDCAGVEFKTNPVGRRKCRTYTNISSTPSYNGWDVSLLKEWGQTLKDVSVSGGTGMIEHDHTWASESLNNCKTQCITDHRSNCVGVEFKTNPVGRRKCRTYTNITSTPSYNGWDVSLFNNNSSECKTFDYLPDKEKHNGYMVSENINNLNSDLIKIDTTKISKVNNLSIDFHTLLSNNSYKTLDLETFINEFNKMSNYRWDQLNSLLPNYIEIENDIEIRNNNKVYKTLILPTEAFYNLLTSEIITISNGFVEDANTFTFKNISYDLRNKFIIPDFIVEPYNKTLGYKKNNDHIRTLRGIFGIIEIFGPDTIIETMFPTLLAVKSTFTIAGKKIIKLAELSISKRKNRSFS